MARLRERANAHGRSVEAEARTILQGALAEPGSDPWAVVNALREELARSGKTFPDSTELIREDRQR
ncbi:MAG TPA: Arc family DNA-binding protein [Gemmataceae bacterium]|nr:Arc family DNA-binding protein [Gemmataceae bacterium]